MKMVILFTPRRLSSYKATFTLSAKKVYFSFYSMNYILPQWGMISFSKNTGEVEDASGMLDPLMQQFPKSIGSRLP